MEHLLKSFIDTAESLLHASLLIGLILGYAGTALEKRKKPVLLCGILLGLVCAGVMAYMKNATRKIDTSLWNLRNFAVCLGVLLLFLIFTALRKPIRKPAEWVQTVCLVLLSVGLLLYALPDTLAAPYTMLMTEKTVLSSGYILKLTGILFGILLVFLAGLAVKSCVQRLGSGAAAVLLILALLVNGIRQATVCLRIMLTKRIIQSNHTLFEISKFSSNHDSIFLYGVIAVTFVVPLVLYIRSLHVNEPYNTSAERRKIRWKWIVSRRWATLAVCCLLFSVFSMTVLKPLTTRAVELSPVEQANVTDGAVIVPFEQVEDGHLHRFGYTSESGTEIRFIVIKKPNSSSYGIGLDACDICGETGYYEKDGQVVCKLCDVVMNINTIGFKGGCNPIVINYRVENGNIIVPVESLLEYEKEFK